VYIFSREIAAFLRSLSARRTRRHIPGGDYMRVSSSRVATAACLPLAFALAACTASPPTAAPPEPAADAAPSAEEMVARGEKLIIGGGCHDCHTPKTMTERGPEADMSRSLAGHPQDDVITAPFKQDPKSPWTTHTNNHLTAWSGAWGVSFAANLTPDQNTGLGIWTEEMFLAALKTGKHMGTSRQILPPMPWNYYGQLPDEDLKAMFAYLKSIKPVANRVPVPLDPSGKPIEEQQ
jgi:mono/diheme cytochrome c family protein